MALKRPQFNKTRGGDLKANFLSWRTNSTSTPVSRALWPFVTPLAVTFPNSGRGTCTGRSSSSHTAPALPTLISWRQSTSDGENLWDVLLRGLILTRVHHPAWEPPLGTSHASPLLAALVLPSPCLLICCIIWLNILISSNYYSFQNFFFQIITILSKEMQPELMT